MKFVGEIADPIHKFIRFTDLERKIIDSSVFQRLRRIKQLAGAHLVYPAAQHSRFEHSLGTMHVAGLAGEHLFSIGVIDKESIQELRVASLLHDIGHGPFSHLFEEALKVTGNKNHETIGAEIICMTELSDILSSFGYSAKTISEISFGNSNVKFKNEIISGSLSADLMDYLPRDGFFTGVEYGKVDYNRIVNSFRVTENQNLALDISSFYSFESMMISRFEMFRAVYFHKTVRSAEVMLLHSILLSSEELNLPRLSLDDYLKLTDDSILWMMASQNNKIAKEMISNYLDRKLLKCVYERFIRKRDNYTKLNRDKIEELRLKIARLANIDERKIFLDTYGISLVPLAPNKKEMKSILLVSEDEFFKQPVSNLPLVNSITGYLDMIRVYTNHKDRKNITNISKDVLDKELPEKQ
ncbi:MAG TPA: HD domain-containing protein [Nitrososphaeraceae archaeon]|jgi:HD superfamily phosphohydrolase|nr:HD domain-containing protein [Nitrososphaeraceae archaeon]